MFQLNFSMIPNARSNFPSGAAGIAHTYHVKTVSGQEAPHACAKKCSADPSVIARLIS